MADDPWAEFRLKPAAPATTDPWAEFRIPQQSPDVGDTLKDYAKSAGSGLVRGATGLAGLPGTVSELGAHAADLLYGKITGQNGQYAAQRQADRSQDWRLPTGQDIQSAVEKIAPSVNYEPQSTAGQYIKTIGEFAPGSLLGGGGLSGGLKAMATTAIPGGIASEGGGQLAQKYAPEYETAARLAGGLLGPGALRAAGHVITPLPTSPETQGFVKTLSDEGVPLTAGQSTGKLGLKYAETELGRGEPVYEAQRQAFVNAALKRIGVDDPEAVASPETLQKAYKDIGQKFEVARQYDMPATPKFGQDLAKVLREYKPPASQVDPSVSDFAKDIVDMSRAGGGKLTGDQYLDLRSRIGKEAQAAHDDYKAARAFTGLKNVLDDTMAQAMPAQDAATLKEGIRQYRNYIPIERAANSAGEASAYGEFSPQALSTALKAQNKRDYAHGKGDLADLSRAGTALLRKPPESGTAARSRIHAISSLPGAILGGSIGMHGAPVELGMEAGAVGAGLGAAAMHAGISRGLMSRPVQGYLKNQLLARALRSKAPTTTQKLVPAVASALSNH